MTSCRRCVWCVSIKYARHLDTRPISTSSQQIFALVSEKLGGETPLETNPEPRANPRRTGGTLFHPTPAGGGWHEGGLLSVPTPPPLRLRIARKIVAALPRTKNRGLPPRIPRARIRGARAVHRLYVDCNWQQPREAHRIDPRPGPRLAQASLGVKRRSLGAECSTNTKHSLVQYAR